MNQFSAKTLGMGASTLVALAIGLAACGSSSSSTSSSSPTALITNAWTQFFSGKTSAADKIKLLQNGQQFAQVINAQAGSAIAQSSDTTVSKVTVNSSTSATVTYTINLGGKPALQNETGTAVNVGGNWLVGVSSFCALLQLEGQSVPACSGAASSSAG